MIEAVLGRTRRRADANRAVKAGCVVAAVIDRQTRMDQDSIANRPLVSVITPAFNAEQYVAETLDSVFAQTYDNYEVIVADDGSTDRTAEIVKARYPKARYFWQPNGGQPAARNLGLRHARGDMIAFLDSDDLFLPEMLETQVATLIDHPNSEWCYGDALFFSGSPDNVVDRGSASRRCYEGDVLEQLFLNNFIMSGTLLFRRGVFDKTGPWDESVSSAEDWNMYLQIAKHCPNLKFTNKALALRRLHADSKIQRMPVDRYLKTHLEILERAATKDPKRLHPLLDEAYSIVYLKIGKLAISRGRKIEGRRHLLQSLRYRFTDPRPIAYWLASWLPDGILRRVWKVVISARMRWQATRLG